MRRAWVEIAIATLLCAGSARADEPAAPPPPAVVAPLEPAPRPLKRRPMFWLAVLGGVAVVASGVTLAIVLGNATRDPSATIGVGTGN